MKIHIEAESQEEFDNKREALLKALAGKNFKIEPLKDHPTIYDLEKPALSPRKAIFRAQNEMMGHWDKKYKAMVNNIKKEISEVLGGIG